MFALVNPELLPKHLKLAEQPQPLLPDLSGEKSREAVKGDIILCSTAKSMIEQYYDRLEKASKHNTDISIENEPLGVFVPKQTLMSLLAQRDCEGIIIYFGLNNKEQTVVLIGMDENNEQLPADSSGTYQVYDNLAGCCKPRKDKKKCLDERFIKCIDVK